MPKYCVKNTGWLDIELDGRTFAKGQTSEPLDLNDDELNNLTAFSRLQVVSVELQAAKPKRGAQPAASAPDAPVPSGDTEGEAV